MVFEFFENFYKTFGLLRLLGAQIGQCRQLELVQSLLHQHGAHVDNGLVILEF